MLIKEEDVIKNEPASSVQLVIKKMDYNVVAKANDHVDKRSWPGNGNQLPSMYDQLSYNKYNDTKKKISSKKLAKKRKRLEKRIAALKAKTDCLRRNND